MDLVHFPGLKIKIAYIKHLCAKLTYQLRLAFNSFACRAVHISNRWMGQVWWEKACLCGCVCVCVGVCVCGRCNNKRVVRVIKTNSLSHVQSQFACLWNKCVGVYYSLH